MSRVIERRMALGVVEKEKLRRLMRQSADFCGVSILTYAVMGNHWHMLVEVPVRQEISDRELVRRLGIFYSKELVKEIGRQLKACRAAGDEAGRERLRARYTYRMGEISEFMKMMKQRYTQWYNRREGRKGTLWEDRFKSILVEGSEKALTTMAAYIDLNAVRAGLVKDPKDYRYCGYGEAMGGGAQAREGVRRVMAAFGRTGGWVELVAEYRKYVYVQGGSYALDENGIPERPGLALEEVEKVLAEKGRLPLGAALRCRVRYFSDGVALGSREFVESVFQENREQFGVKRRTGARGMKWGDWGGLCTARDLRLQVVSTPAQG